MAARQSQDPVSSTEASPPKEDETKIFQNQNLCRARWQARRVGKGRHPRGWALGQGLVSQALTWRSPECWAGFWLWTWV
eukprot:2839494-Amphidinium_carterae.2